MQHDASMASSDDSQPMNAAFAGRVRPRARRATSGLLAVIMLASALVTTSPATPAEAISYGDMVTYEMIFPVDATDYFFRDTFGDCRDGCARSHQGIDIYAAKGTRVVATSPGTVRYVNWSRSADLNPGRCCSLVIDHDDGWQTRYIHLNNDTPGTDDGKGWGIADGIAPGARVSAGQLIGWLGDSGNAENSRPQLHFELRAPGDIVTNPYQALVNAPLVVYDDPPATADDGLFDSTATVRRGDRGAAVEQLQEILNDLGYSAGTADGIFGAKTEAAVRAFQTDNELTADGLVGRKTKQALEDQWRPLPTLRRGDRSDDVAYLQGLLNDAGFDAGPTDGIFGGRTESAVRGFQTDNDLTVDGIVGRQTWTELRS
jgi:murein DD-endopeptidase MepM/ murein hydrolase activator NlpD